MNLIKKINLYYKFKGGDLPLWVTVLISNNTIQNFYIRKISQLVVYRKSLIMHF